MGPVVAILLAAGAGRRAGGPKALLSLRGESFLVHAARRLGRPGVGAVVAVLGHQADQAAAEARAAGIDWLVNLHPDDGMLGSVILGLDEADRRGASGVLVHPVDHPVVAVQTVDRVVEALRAGARIAVPSWEMRRGHPAGFARSVFPELRAAPMDQGLRAVLAAHGDAVVHVDGDPGCRLGVNTPEDYGRLVRAAT